MPDQPGRPEVHLEVFWYGGEQYCTVTLARPATPNKFAERVKSFAVIALVRRVFVAVRGSHGPADAIRRFQQTR